jgi:16S rRNA (cytosine967-C5)-methyltransferase
MQEERHRQSDRPSGASVRALQAAMAIYARWEAERERSPLDRVVAAEFRSRRHLNSRERRWVAEAVYGCVRFLRRQRWLLAQLALPDTAETQLALWSALRAVEGESEPAMLSPLRGERLESALAALPQSSEPYTYLRTTLSFPDPMADALEALLGAEAVSAGEAFNTQAPTTLRVNPLRATRAQVHAALPGTRPTRYSPWGLELPARVNIYDLPGFRAGWFEVQEEASQLAALLMDAQPEQTIVDVGAGAGGKTLALAASMQNRGRLVALDTSGARLEELQKRAQRAGVTHVETGAIVADAEGQWQPTGPSARAWERLRGAADGVLVDAPCTGSGVLRRSPDAKWRVSDPEAFARIQYMLLEQAGALVAPGGTLVYVTCAFERSQNEAIVEAFLASASGERFTLDPAAPRLHRACLRADALAAAPARNRYSGPNVPRVLPSGDVAIAANIETLMSGPYLRTWPHRHGLDAFFGVCLRRQTS